jgi:hypothetical protein
MRYAEIIKESDDPVVKMAQQRLQHSKIENDKNRLRVKQAQERKIKKDIAAKQRLNFKESELETDDAESIESKFESSEDRTEFQDIEKDKRDIWVDEVGLPENKRLHKKKHYRAK